MSEYEAYQKARVVGFIPADQSFEEYLLAEVRRLRERLISPYDWAEREVKRLREGIEHALHIRLRHGQEEGWKELKELIE